MPQNRCESETSQNYLERTPICGNRQWLLTCAVVVFEINPIRHGNTHQRYLFASLFSTGKNIYRSIIIEVNLVVLRSRHIKTTEFCSCCCFCVRHEKLTDKLSVRQQSIYCVRNARNAPSRKHWAIAVDWDIKNHTKQTKLFAKECI